MKTSTSTGYTKSMYFSSFILAEHKGNCKVSFSEIHPVKISKFRLKLQLLSSTIMCMKYITENDVSSRILTMAYPYYKKKGGGSKCGISRVRNSKFTEKVKEVLHATKTNCSVKTLYTHKISG